MMERHVRRSTLTRLIARSALLGTLVACHDSATAPAAAELGAPAIAPARITCSADTRARTVACSGQSASAGVRASADLILGGQNTFVRLASSNVSYVGDVFAFDATVQNLITQTLGTADGTALDPSGVRVFFDAAPTTLSGTGSVDFIDPVSSTSTVDGYAVFTASNQPYYQYNEMIAANQVSSAKHWRLHVPASVTSFDFTVYVSAAVQYPNGSVALSTTGTNPKPTQTRTLTAVVTDVVGRNVADPIAWSSSAPAIATVDASGVVTAVSSGSAIITATSTTRSATRTITVVGSTWLGGTSNDFNVATNWSGSVLPTATDSILIPAVVPNIPRLSVPAAVSSVELQAGASLDLNGQTLTVANNVNAGTVAGGGGISNGTLQVNGTSTSSIVGILPTTTILGSATACSGALFSLNGATSTPGSITLNCPLTIGANALTTSGGLTTAKNGTLAMASASSAVTVGGTMTFGGASETGLLTAGTFDVKGDFTQVDNGGVTNNFVGGTGFTVRLSGTGAQAINIASPMTATFYNLNVTNASTSGVTITSIVQVSHDLTLGASAKVSGTFAGGGKRLIVGGAVTTANTANLGGLDSLQVTGNTFPSYANITVHTAPRVTQLTGAAVVIAADVTVAGGLSVGIPGTPGTTLNIGGHSLTVKDSLILDDNLDMLSSTPNNVVSVSDTIRFRGGSTTGHLQRGTLRVGGNFVEEGYTATSFVSPTLNFLVQLNGSSSTRAQEVRFLHPGAAASHFGSFEIDNTSVSGVTFTSDVNISGFLEQKGRLAIASATTTSVSGTSSFRNGAFTTVSGTLALDAADFYNGSHTTGTGTLTTGTCRYGTTVTPGDLLVGSSFNQLNCSRTGLP